MMIDAHDTRSSRSGERGPSAPQAGAFAGRRLLFVVNEGFFLLSHRREVMRSARAAGFELHVAAPPHHAWAPEDFDLDQLAAEGAIVHPFPMSRRGLNPVTDAETFLALLRLYRRVKPDVVHHVTIKPNLYGGLAARLLGVPSAVFAVPGLGEVFSGNPALIRLLRPAIGRALGIAFAHPNCRIIVQNEEDRGQLVRRRMAPPDRIVLIRGSGVDTAKFVPAPIPPGVPVVVMAARLIWDKGVAEFVEAARRLRASGIAARFVLVGASHPSNPRAVPEADLLAWEKEGVVEWWMFRKDMGAVLSSAAVVCLPSTYGEGVPKILLEAAAVGRATVTTDTPGCRDAVVDGRTGLLVPPGDAQALSVALRRLLTDAPLRDAMGAAARERVAAEFDEGEVAARTLAVYSALMSAPAAE